MSWAAAAIWVTFILVIGWILTTGIKHPRPQEEENRRGK